MITLRFDRTPPTHPHVHITHTITFNRTVGNSGCSDGGNITRFEPPGDEDSTLVPRCSGVRGRFHTLPFVLRSYRSFYFKTPQPVVVVYTVQRVQVLLLQTPPPLYHINLHHHNPCTTIYAVEYQTVPRSYNCVYQLYIGAIAIYLYIYIYKTFPFGPVIS